MLIVQRVFFFMLLLINWFATSNEISEGRLYLNAIGVGIHIISLLCLVYLPYNSGFQQRIHAAVVIISYQIFVLNVFYKNSEHEVITFVGQQMVISVCVVILSQQWIVTSLALFFAFATSALYYSVGLHYYIGVIIPQICLLFLVLVYVSYFSERRSKSEFLQI
jgi:hypothetical protein